MDSVTPPGSVIVLVRGLGDIGSAVAHLLFREGYGVVIHDGPKPATTRRGMAFADAAFDGSAELEGVRAVRTRDLAHVRALLEARATIPVYVRPWGPLLEALQPAVLVDARMEKHAPPEVQRGYAPVTIGLGPGLIAGRHADIIVETAWTDLGAVITAGTSLRLSGEPRAIEGHARDRLSEAGDPQLAASDCQAETTAEKGAARQTASVTIHGAVPMAWTP